MKITPFARKGNYTNIDNYIFDHVMPNVTPNAFKVLCLIARKTKGWHKDDIQLTYNDIRTGTGISSDATISKSIVELISNSLITITTNREYEGNFYGLNKDLEVEVQESSTSIIEVQETSSTTENEVQEPSTTVFGGTSTTENEVQEPVKTDVFTPSCTTENEVPKESIKENNIPPTEVVSQLSKPLAQQFHGLVDELKTTKNRAAKLVEIYILLYGKETAPQHGYILKVANQIGGAGFMAHRLWELSARPPNGDILAYLVAEHRAKSQRKAYTNGKVESNANWHTAFDNSDAPDYIKQMQQGEK